MPRIVKLVRRVTATPGGWAGDGTVWSGDDPDDAPKVATTNAVEVGSPIFRVAGKGVAGIMLVKDGNGAPSSKRFNMRLVLAWEKVASGVHTTEWREPVGSAPPTPPDARNIGDGEEFTTDPMLLAHQDIAFHLVPIGGNLSSTHVVEIWAEGLE